MTLQAALIILGVVALGVVFAASYYRDKLSALLSRAKPSISPLGRSLVRSRDFILGRVDPRRDDDRSGDEPTLGRLDEVEQLDIGFEHRLDDGDEVDPVPAPSSATPVATKGADVPEEGPRDEGSVRQLDYWVRIIGDEPVERDRILAIYRHHEYLFEHPHSIHGRAVPSGEWCDMERQPDSTRFTDVVMTLQLCDRTGPVSESELTQFTNLVFSVSESLDRQFRLQGSVEEALEQARRLERFWAEYDVFAIINICGEGDRQFRGPEVLRAVEGSGMRYGDMRVFHGPESASGDPLYSLANMVKPGIFELDKIKAFTTPGLTMFMSVPRCASPGDVFGRMAYVAGKISNQLGGVMLDQKKQPLDDASIKQIRKQVEDMGAAMTAKGISPGSEEALRLF